MLWSKQYYLFDVDTWLKEHEAHPLVGTAKRTVRNAEWFHMFNGDIISMPDKWEYPWYAAWNLPSTRSRWSSSTSTLPKSSS